LTDTLPEPSLLYGARAGPAVSHGVSTVPTILLMFLEKVVSKSELVKILDVEF
jgi:hypothetical protein